MGTTSGGLHLIDTDTGEERWRYVGGVTLAGFSAELEAEGRQLVVVTNSGRILSFVDASDGTADAENDEGGR